MRRRTMLAPIRPSPTIPICIECVLLKRAWRIAGALAGRGEWRLVDEARERFETGGDVGAEMDAEHAAASLREHGDVAPGLRRLDDAERVLLPRHREIAGVVGRDLQEDALVGAALVGLPGRVQEARAEADAGRDVRAI